MYCAISGEVPHEPVVSSASGHLFERRLIEKALEASSGVCPATGVELTMKQLIPVKADLAVRPRPLTATSLPGLLALFQNEWDDVMLETHSMKQQLHSTRKELSHALYQHDAACRVIARLSRERDDARQMVADLQRAVASGAVASGAASSGSQPMEVEAAKPALGADVVAHMTDFWKKVSKGRKKRPVSKALSSQGDLKQFSKANSQDLFGSASGGATGLDVRLSDGALVVGGGSGAAVFLATAEAAAAKTEEAHATGSVAMAFVASEQDGGVVCVSGGADGSIKAWTQDKTGSLALKCQGAGDGGAVCGVAPHPSGRYVACFSEDASWTLYALGDALTALAGSGPSAAGERATGCLAFHPDGLILAAPSSCADGSHLVRVWDVKEQKNVHSFSGHTARVNSVAFSENGYYMASASDDGSVKVWDLRKLEELTSIASGAPAATCAAFDHSGKYLAYATEQGVTVVAVKEWSTPLVVLPTDGAATQLRFGPDAQFIAAGTAAGKLELFKLL